jgi:hypothetical protein
MTSPPVPPSSADDHRAQETPDSLGAGPITIHDRNHLRVWAELDSQGALVVRGQDLKPDFDEYEYAFVIPREDLSLIQVALGGTNDDSVLDLLSVHGERLVAEGFMSWLDAVGARYKFWSR